MKKNLKDLTRENKMIKYTEQIFGYAKTFTDLLEDCSKRKDFKELYWLIANEHAILRIEGWFDTMQSKINNSN